MGNKNVTCPERQVATYCWSAAGYKRRMRPPILSIFAFCATGCLGLLSCERTYDELCIFLCCLVLSAFLSVK